MFTPVPVSEWGQPGPWRARTGAASMPSWLASPGSFLVKPRTRSRAARSRRKGGEGMAVKKRLRTEPRPGVEGERSDDGWPTWRLRLNRAGRRGGVGRPSLARGARRDDPRLRTGLRTHCLAAPTAVVPPRTVLTSEASGTWPGVHPRSSPALRLSPVREPRAGEVSRSRHGRKTTAVITPGDEWLTPWQKEARAAPAGSPDDRLLRFPLSLARARFRAIDSTARHSCSGQDRPPVLQPFIWTSPSG
jgi:hypothetical protein